MKNAQGHSPTPSQHHFTNSPFHHLLPLLFFFTLFLFSACESDQNQSDVFAEAPPPYEAHVAFAGGGWRAHSGHSGWIIALLNNGSISLDSVFSNVKTISSNSGGSWFSSMLMYSDDFVSQIQQPGAASSWAQTGWLGQQKQLFHSTTPFHCEDLSEDAFIVCVTDYLTSSDLNPAGALYWKKLVDSIVFRDYPLTAKLGDAPVSWAADKSLLLAGSLLSGQVALNINDDGDINFYQACLPIYGQPILKGKEGASCTFDSPIPAMTPVTFSRVPSSYTAPPFLSALGEGKSLSIGYTDDTWFASDTVSRVISLQNPISSDQLLVQDGAGASSAALGFGASANVSGSLNKAYLLEDEAFSFKLKDQTVQYLDPGDMVVEDFAENIAVRIADGGPVDNSGVAQLVRYLQLNDMDNNFNIIAFDNVQQPYIANGDTVGMDIANLFGHGICKENQFCEKVKCGGTCIQIPTLDIFEGDSLAMGNVVWSISNSTSDTIKKIIYTQYPVKTVANANYGIVANSEGTLHAFSCIWENATDIPDNGGDGEFPGKFTDYQFNNYAQMIDFINSSMQANGGARLKEMRQAFGIAQ